ncbi:MAG TPA: EFR1 family ferrodoxin [Clostridia bacterium]
MNTGIFYFSGTGNSLFAAKKLAENLEGQYFNVSKSVKDQEIVLDYEVLGFVFPVYAYTYPKVLDLFIKKAKLKTAPKFAFIIITYGSTPGRAAQKFAKKLKKLFKVNYISGARMPENYVAIFKPDSPEIVEKKMTEALVKLDKISQDIKDRIEFIEKRDTPLDYIKTGFVGTVFNMFLPFSHLFFKAGGQCNGCDLCVKVCPVNNIVKANNKPKWRSKCVQCMACINWCPRKNINYTPITKKRSRYTNPNIKINELF